MKKSGGKLVKNITVGFLDCLLGIAEGFVITVDRKEVYRRAYGYFEHKLTVREIGKKFDSLRRRGYLEVVNNNQALSFRFTNKAKLALVDKIADAIEAEQKFYFVSFDIPESMRSKRNAFRRVIKQLGFREIQKSLWACNKNVGEYVEMAAIEHQIIDYIVYLATDNTNVNSTLIAKMNRNH